jgi:transcriptional regulator with GAF, ATPase, and Fis domain
MTAVAEARVDDGNSIRSDCTRLHPDRAQRPLAPEDTITGESPAIRRVIEQVHQVSATPATVLLLGETGVGKEVFAEAIHAASPRHPRSMIKVSCTAMPATLIESELFGHECGAFTNASSRRIGRFEAANRSTIFLDEIGELPLELQAKLLRVLQERTVERLGGGGVSVNLDVRVIAATNRNLEAAVADGAFRQDLYYRLNVFPVTIPPLRERLEDMTCLVRTFVQEFSRAFNRRIDVVSQESLDALRRYDWPGNVRELRNVIERAMITATGPTLTVRVPETVERRLSPSQTLVNVETEHIRQVLHACGWRIRGAGGAAERLDIKPTTLESRMARLGIARREQAAVCSR